MANPNPNQSNLRKFKKNDRETCEKASKGGKASQAKIKKKKELHEQLQLAIDILTKQQLKKKGLSEEQREIIEATDVIIYDLITIAANPKERSETRLRAKDMLLDRIYGKPKQEIESTNLNKNIDIDMTDMSDEQLKRIADMSPEQLTNLAEGTKKK